MTRSQNGVPLRVAREDQSMELSRNGVSKELNCVGDVTIATVERSTESAIAEGERTKSGAIPRTPVVGDPQGVYNDDSLAIPFDLDQQ